MRWQLNRSVRLARLSLRRHLAIQLRRHLEPLWAGLGDVESWLLRGRLPAVDRPIYVTGMARTGTTITLETLSRHEDVATHRYLDMAQPFLPYLWHHMARRLPLPAATAQERICLDRIMVTRDSPEAVEEALWMRYFPRLHDEAVPAVLGRETSCPRFEAGYAAHIGKLLLARGRPRYLSKSDDNLTRLAYLVRLFPGARFIVMVRQPELHFASWMKQHQLYERLQAHDPRWFQAIRTIGHHAFGRDQRFVNLGDPELSARIRSHWDAGRHARAFGLYWAATYGHVAALCEADVLVRKAVLIVRYEEFCADPHASLGAMLAHAQLDPGRLQVPLPVLAAAIAAPAYYQATLDDAERADLCDTTSGVARRLGCADARAG